MSKPRMVTIEARLLRKMVSLIKRQQKCLEKWVVYAKQQRPERGGITISPAAAGTALKTYRGKR